MRLAFAISINKAQGQGQFFKVVGVDLSSSCFSNGQLYVACSRVGSAENLFVCAAAGETKNIVYPKALH